MFLLKELVPFLPLLTLIFFGFGFIKLIKKNPNFKRILLYFLAGIILFIIWFVIANNFY